MKRLLINFLLIILSIGILIIIIYPIYQSKAASKKQELQLIKLNKLLDTKNINLTLIPTNSSKSYVKRREPILSQRIKTNLVNTLKKSHKSDMNGKGRFIAVNWETELKIEGSQDSIFLKIIDNGIYPQFIIKSEKGYERRLVLVCNNLTSEIENIK